MTAPFAKSLFVIVSLVVIAAVLLTLRQQRFETMHEMAQLNNQMNADRQALWNLQTDIGRRMETDALRASMLRAQLNVEPVRTVLPVETVVQGEAR